MFLLRSHFGLLIEIFLQYLSFVHSTQCFSKPICISAFQNTGWFESRAFSILVVSGALDDADPLGRTYFKLSVASGDEFCALGASSN
jgi:hypothetical protein